MRQSSAGSPGTTDHRAEAAFLHSSMPDSVRRHQPSRYRADGEVGGSGGGTAAWLWEALAMLLIAEVITMVVLLLVGG